MFGRRKRAKVATTPAVLPVQQTVPVAVPEPRALAPRLDEEQVLALVQARLEASFGADGQWAVRRRENEDTDDIFRSVFTRQLAADVASALRAAQLRLEAGEAPLRAVTAPAHTAPAQVEVTAIGDATPAAPTRAAAALPAEHEFTPAALEPAALASVPSTSAELAEQEPESDESAAELDEDKVALQWQPAPITVWTDLKKPVTGEIALKELNRVA